MIKINYILSIFLTYSLYFCGINAAEKWVGFNKTAVLYKDTIGYENPLTKKSLPVGLYHWADAQKDQYGRAIYFPLNDKGTARSNVQFFELMPGFYVQLDGPSYSEENIQWKLSNPINDLAQAERFGKHPLQPQRQLLSQQQTIAQPISTPSSSLFPLYQQRAQPFISSQSPMSSSSKESSSVSQSFSPFVQFAPSSSSSASSISASFDQPPLPSLPPKLSHTQLTFSMPSIPGGPSEYKQQLSSSVNLDDIAIKFMQHDRHLLAEYRTEILNEIKRLNPNFLGNKLKESLNKQGYADRLLDAGVEQNDESMVELALQADDVDKDHFTEHPGFSRIGFGVTPLARAAELGYINIVQLLLNRGADVDKADERLHCWEGYTPLSLAVQNKHPDIVNLLRTYKSRNKAD